MQNCKHEIKNRLEFMLAGKSIFTLQSEKTKSHFTYKVTRAKQNNEYQDLWFVSGFTGTDNYSHYKYFGIIIKTNGGLVFKPGKKSKLDSNSLIVNSFEWFFKNLNTDKLRFFHENHCARCGRKLTEPKSIETGFGPYCRGVK